MTRSNLNIRNPFVLLVLTCLCWAPAGVSAQVSDEAKVVFMRGSKAFGGGPAAVFVDNDFHGELRPDSYLETSVSPGPHLVSGDWVRFSGDAKYCFIWSGDSWLLHSPHSDIEVHQSDTATQIARASDTTARQRSEVHRTKYEKALRRAGDPPTPQPTVNFDEVFHSEKLMSAKNLFRFKAKGGRLSIDENAVRFESKKKRIEIPVAELLSVNFAGFKPNDPDPWLGLIHGTIDNFEIEYFSPRGQYNSVFIALQEAIEAAESDEQESSGEAKG